MFHLCNIVLSFSFSDHYGITQLCNKIFELLIRGSLTWINAQETLLLALVCASTILLLSQIVGHFQINNIVHLKL